MNANALWSGHHYAYDEYRGRGKFLMNAVKVKVLRVSKKRQYGNDNATTFAEVEFENGKTKEVSARKIIDFWDSYVSERDTKLEEIAERTRKYQEESARRARERQEQAEKMDAGNAAIKKGLVAAGISPDAVTSWGSLTLSIDRRSVIEWLGLPEDTV